MIKEGGPSPEKGMDPSGLGRERAELPALTWYKIKAIRVVGLDRGVKKKKMLLMLEEVQKDQGQLSTFQGVEDFAYLPSISSLYIQGSA